MDTLFLPIADASKQFNVSESTLRRAAKQLIANNSTNVRAIKIKNGYRYELSQEYLLQNYSFDQSKEGFDQSKIGFDQSKSGFDQSKEGFDQLEIDTLKYERNRLFEAHIVLLTEVGNLNFSLNKERDRYDRLSENYTQLQAQTNMLHAKQLQLIEQKQSSPSPMQASSQQGNNYGFVWFLVGLVFGLVVLGIIVVWA